MKLAELVNIYLRQNIRGMAVSVLGNQLYRYGDTASAQSFSHGHAVIQLALEEGRALLPEDQDVVGKLVTLAFPRGTKEQLAHASIRIMRSVLGGQAVDETLNDILWELVGPDQFERSAVMLLNETLMELKGVILAVRGSTVDAQKIRFRSARFPLSGRNTVSDAMFYDRTEQLNFADIPEASQMLEFFTGDVLVAPLVAGDHPIGIICMQKAGYEVMDVLVAEFFAKLCTLAVESNKSRTRMSFARQDIEQLKSSFYATDTLVKIGKLATTIAHELKNPLVAIGGFAQRMEGLTDDEQARQYARIIQHEADRLELIVGEILSYAKRIDVKREAYTLRNLVLETLTLLQERLEEQGIVPLVDIPEELAAFVDVKRFKQVLLNVLNNAVYVMPEGGRVFLRSRESHSNIVLSVEDTGGGIPDALMHRVFEPFFTTKESGTGLGLPLCKKIMMSHGGDMTAENGREGAVVSIIIPKGGIKREEDIDC